MAASSSGVCSQCSPCGSSVRLAQALRANVSTVSRGMSASPSAQRINVLGETA